MINALLVAVAVVAGVWVRWTVAHPVTHQSADRIVTIDPGIGTDATIARLEEAGIVRHPIALRLYLTVTGRSSRLKAGDYKFTSPISPLEAIDKIRRGDVYYERVTIPEGFNTFEIADLLAAKTGKATRDQFLALMADPSLIHDVDPSAKTLEGYLFPDTYNYSTRTTAEDLIRTMVRRFDDVFGDAWTRRAAELKMDVHQVVTLASIVEKEAKVPEDRPLIASTLTNRLRIGMPLAADPTFIYAAEMAHDYDGNPNQPRHRRRNSPYNTYLYPGLPPGPIASPGRASLEAALYPANTNYLYYVLAGADGHHKFSRTAAEHQAAVEQYHQLRQQLQNGGS
ncbi:MAG TPA: endolytic transglycosylase MltG [Blastocatellia bacterium]|nr:endolytic transglycosylase MltG [Blastocatellia bacterium]